MISVKPLTEAEIEALIGSADVTEFLNTRSARLGRGFKNQPPTKTQAIKLMAQIPISSAPDCHQG